MTKLNSGFTFIEIMVVTGIIGLLAGITIPNLTKARSYPQRNACINNLRQLEGAKEQWAMENNMGTSDTPVDSDLVGTDKYLKTMPRCPASGAYTYNDMTAMPTCTINDHTLN